jgi:cytochrome c peroxidase
MHDGSIATLDEVLSHYGDHGRGDPGTEATVLAVDLNLEEQRDVVAFLESLTDEQFLSYPGFREANDL